MECPKILVVEDEQNLALEIRSSLQKLGYGLAELTTSGEEAVKKVAEIHPNLVIIDICLAGQINGVRITDIIQNNFQIPVLYLTKHLEDTQLHRNLLIQPLNKISQRVSERDLYVAIEIALYKHQLEKKLQQEKQNLLAIIHSMGCGIVVQDTRGYIQMINPITEMLTGCKENEVRGKELTELLTLVDKETEEVIENLVTEATADGTVLNLPENCTLINKNGRQMPVGGTVAPIRNSDGETTGTVLVFQDISQRKYHEAQLVRNAFYDALTGLPNRVFFLKKLSRRFERGKRRENYRFAILFLDLDGFKAVNDNFGHGMGDELLNMVARRLESCLRSGDTVARFGGDEFAVLVEEIRDCSDATNVARRIQETLSLPLYLGGNQLSISASIGIALNSSAYDLADHLLRDADVAMYRAKKQGKAKYNVFG